MSIASNLKFAFQYLTGLGIRPCGHAGTVKFTSLSAGQDSECKKCAELGTDWVHLRMCTSCGEVVCCDSSKEQHARNHVEETGHPITVSVEPGESWQWCYIDNRLVAKKAQ